MSDNKATFTESSFKYDDIFDDSEYSSEELIDEIEDGLGLDVSGPPEYKDPDVDSEWEELEILTPRAAYNDVSQGARITLDKIGDNLDRKSVISSVVGKLGNSNILDDILPPTGDKDAYWEEDFDNDYASKRISKDQNHTSFKGEKKGRNIAKHISSTSKRYAQKPKGEDSGSTCSKPKDRRHPREDALPTAAERRVSIGNDENKKREVESKEKVGGKQRQAPYSTEIIRPFQQKQKKAPTPNGREYSSSRTQKSPSPSKATRRERGQKSQNGRKVFHDKPKATSTESSEIDEDRQKRLRLKRRAKEGEDREDREDRGDKEESLHKPKEDERSPKRVRNGYHSPHHNEQPDGYRRRRERSPKKDRHFREDRREERYKPSSPPSYEHGRGRYNRSPFSENRPAGGRGRGRGIGKGRDRGRGRGRGRGNSHFYKYGQNKHDRYSLSYAQLKKENSSLRYTLTMERDLLKGKLRDYSFPRTEEEFEKWSLKDKYFGSYEDLTHVQDHAHRLIYNRAAIAANLETYGQAYFTDPNTYNAAYNAAYAVVK